MIITISSEDLIASLLEIKAAQSLDEVFPLVDELIDEYSSEYQSGDLYRVRHDVIPRMILPGWPNPKMLQAPEVYPLQILGPHGKPQGTDRINLSKYGWDTYFGILNPPIRKFNYATNPHSGSFNNTGWPQMETLIYGGNAVEVVRIKGQLAQIRTMQYADGPQDQPTYQSDPLRVQKFTVVTLRGDVIPPPPGDIFFPVVAKNPLWISLSQLEPFPPLPLTVTTITRLNVRKAPGTDSETLFTLPEGATVTIKRYSLRGSEVWAMTSDGWIALYYGAYLTNWRMTTLPPP
ncbi:MAG: hypothetical protein Fur0043_26630 [Anaerolineales bacterium]